MLTTRRQFLTQAAGGLLLASAAAHAQTSPAIRTIILSGAVLVPASGYIPQIAINAGYTSNMVLGMSTSTGELGAGQRLGVNLKLSDPLRLTVSTVGGKPTTPTVVEFLVGHNAIMVHKDAAGTLICRAVIYSSYSAESATVKLAFAAR